MLNKTEKLCLFVLWVIGIVLSGPSQAQVPNPLERGSCPQWQRMDLMANVEVKTVMVDVEGDHWVVIRNISTGKTKIGFLRNRQLFCQISEGKVNKES